MPAVFVYAGDGPWWLAPLLFFAPLILPHALRPFIALGYLLQELLLPVTRPAEWDRAAGGRVPLRMRLLSPEHRAAAGITLLDLTVAAVLPAVLLFLLAWTVTQVQRHGWRHLVRRIFSRPGDPARAGGSSQGRRGGQSHEQRFEEVIKMLHQLPAEEFAGREQLMVLPAHDLKARLRSAGLQVPAAAEKGELVGALLSNRPSSDATCSICCEDYEAGDVLRRLHCSHSFHLECIDRWLLSSTDYSRPAACPMCNQPLAAGSTTA